MIILTGCAGFIGSHLTEKLLRDDHEVIGIDCFTDHYPKKIKEHNMKNFIKNKEFTFINKDIMHFNFSEIARDVDYVFHLAAQTGVRASWGSSFELYARNNISITQKMLEAFKDSGIKKFVYSSSSSVYGDADALPVKENAEKRPVSPYGVTKLAGENLCYLYSMNYGLPVLSLRYFTVYGPRQRPDMAFDIFINSILSGKEITIYGDGRQTRDFTFVSDVVDANILSMKHTNKYYDVFNIAGGSRIKLLDAIRIIENLVGEKAKIKMVANAKGDAKDTYADITKAMQTISYSPKIKIEEGLRLQVEHIRRR